MNAANWTRQHLRAPIYAEAIFAEETITLPGYCSNVSEGGCFLKSNNNKVSNTVFSVMFLITQYPDFYSLTRSELFALNRDTLQNYVIRAKVVVRRTIQISDDQFRFGHGCKFINITSDEKVLIDNYVKRYSRNIVFVLNLFEALDNTNNNVSLIRSLTRFLGYSENLKLPFVRQKLLHDYQSLESNFNYSN